MAYSKTNWVNDSTPAINATNLNKIEQGIYDLDVKLGENSEAYETFAVQAYNFDFNLSDPTTSVVVSFTTYDNKKIGYYMSHNGQLYVGADENGTETSTNRFSFTIPRYSLLVFTIHAEGGLQAQVKTYSNLTKDDIVLFGNLFAGANAPNNFNGILWDKYSNKKNYDSWSGVSKIGDEKTITGTTTVGSNFNSNSISVNIKQGETFCVRVDAEDFEAQSLIVLRKGTTNLFTINNYDFGKYLFFTAPSDLTSVVFYISSTRIISSTTLTMYIGYGEIINAKSNLKNILERPKELITEYTSQKFTVTSNTNVDTNICTINNLNIKNGQKFLIMEKISGNLPTTSQIRIGSTYLGSIKQKYNKWVEFTAPSDLTSISLYIGTSYVTGQFDVEITVSTDLSKEIHDNTVNLESQNPTYYLPDYYTDAWINNLKSQMDILNNSIVNGVSFAFVTDLHFLVNRENSKYLLKHFLNNNCFPIVISGGDYCYAYGTQAQVERDIEKVKNYQEYIGDKFYQVRGNHDFTIKTSAESDTGYTAPFSIVYNRIIKPTEWQVVDCFPDHLCYVIENKAQRTRLICLNTNDGQSDDTSTPWGVFYRVTREQLDWLLNTALNVENYRIIFVQHVPLDDSLSAHSYVCEELFKIAKAIKNKESYSYDGLSKDFTNTTLEFIASISGHAHKDQSIVTNNVLSITTTSDGTFQDDGYERELDTLSEQAFDVFYFNYDAERIDAVRVGAGSNRYWEYGE